MRAFRLAGVIIVIVVCSPIMNIASADEPLSLTSDFIDSIGVGLHIDYGDGGYRDVDRVLESLHYLGISNVRNDAPNPRRAKQSSFPRLAAEGIHFDMISPAFETLPDLAAFQERFPGAVAAIEGVNEINNNRSMEYAGFTGTKAAQAFQAELFNRVKADRVLAAVPVFNFTDYPDHPGIADYGNFHAYAKGGREPTEDLRNGREWQGGVMPGKPLVCTEFGYFTAPTGVGWGGVTEEQQARLLLFGLLENAAAGVKRTYIYQLLDAYPDPAYKDQERHFGLFDIEFKPKIAATTLRNVLAILRDVAPSTSEVPLTPPMVTANARTLLLRSSATEWVLFVWAPESAETMIEFDHSVLMVVEYTPSISRNAITDYHSVNQIKIDKEVTPLVLNIFL